MLKGKKILLGVTGSIAAYKAAFLVRLLIKAGAEVQVLMTPSAQSFITPLTLATLSRRSVFSDLSSEASWNNHVEIGLWADAMVIAPLTAATLSKLANGMCDNIVVAAYLSARCPVFFAPAMDLDMWAHPATQENVRRLEAYGNHLIPVEEGELASGLSGPGRMAEPEAIVQYLDAFWHRAASLKGRRVLITAGPTHEPIDPVRFIGNRSSGKMGLALAAAAARRGAAVTLILGPTHLEVPPGIATTRVQTATEMLQAAQRHFPAADIAILAAAVADYRPGQASEHKIKKQQGQHLALELQENPDIAAALGQAKQPGQILVGFALETQDEEANARAKLEKKNFDCIVINSLQDEQAGFYHDTNKISILYPNNKMRKFELKPKSAVAEDILDAAEALLSESKSIAEL